MRFEFPPDTIFSPFFFMSFARSQFGVDINWVSTRLEISSETRAREYTRFQGLENRRCFYERSYANFREPPDDSPSWVALINMISRYATIIKPRRLTCVRA